LRFLRRLYQSALFYVLLLHLGAMSLTWNLVCLVLYPFLSRRQGVVVGRAASPVYHDWSFCSGWEVRIDPHRARRWTAKTA
jgi:hypothetical protein